MGPAEPSRCIPGGRGQPPYISALLASLPLLSLPLGLSRGKWPNLVCWGHTHPQPDAPAPRPPSPGGTAPPWASARCGAAGFRAQGRECEPPSTGPPPQAPSPGATLIQQEIQWWVRPAHSWAPGLPGPPHGPADELAGVGDLSKGRQEGKESCRWGFF